MVNHVLVGGFNPFWKILVSWDDYSQYMGEKRKNMFQNINQCLLGVPYLKQIQVEWTTV